MLGFKKEPSVERLLNHFNSVFVCRRILNCEQIVCRNVMINDNNVDEAAVNKVSFRAMSGVSQRRDAGKFLMVFLVREYFPCQRVILQRQRISVAPQAAV